MAQFHVISCRDHGTLKPLELLTASVEMNGTDMIIQHTHPIFVLTVNSPLRESLLDDVPQMRIMAVRVIVVIVAIILNCKAPTKGKINGIFDCK